jgi:hypothetical protein
MGAPLRVRSPSAKVLANRCDIYVANSQTRSDAVGGVEFIYPPTPTYSNVPCTAQAMEFEEIVDEQERITQFMHWKFIFGNQQSVNPRDMIIYLDSLGNSHTIYATAQRDEAGRGAAFTIKAVEKI